MSTGLLAKCPGCGLRDQHCGMACGFCNSQIPYPAGSLAPDGTAARVEDWIGYRGWRIERMPDGTPRLASPMFDAIWEPGVTMIANCQNSYGKEEQHGPDNPDPKFWSPVKGCGGGGHGCGFYAGRTREHLMKLGYNRYSEADPHVIGKVQLSGKIIPATNGYRAQKCDILVIYVPFELWKLAAELKAVYGPHGVEVECSATLVMPKDAIAWCKKCGGKMGRDPQCPTCKHVHT